MKDKSTTLNRIHQLPAGVMPGDKSTELFGCIQTRKVYILHNGTNKPFNDLPQNIKKQIVDQYLKDDVAQKDLAHLKTKEALEQFAFCIYGAADSTPDFSETGEFISDDNFMCSNNCHCLKWKTKNITVDGNILTMRQIQIVQLLATDLPDKIIAHELNITESTLNTHKAKLFEKFNVQSKNGLIRKAINQKIIQ
ncbi:DNA-binding CsgD family transcriptional regulator [Mesoflavibacter sabulilitoris]|uniref:DNA-binding response regulator n=1 Tax=Mesoflavibacter zeaxanthinifaciens subsp. sabulilitoris TaxID=1520893 RepID=A0A2T1NAH6_9FLAO|nr:LuxR C-terminal-related transcriptional regulator [Mesoflavibacter zeaxanthinifaciens]MBB3123766.1 DNA-binding CsgD family transcriptional regulator [Mesoflavibacter zeaxanthinifaciens subsp. sabulilitoris]PSG89115.1 DNA-binding response regulator [Mesoflavibacter zeaxanthinifaciens subsp. sabulilitoris]